MQIVNFERFLRLTALCADAAEMVKMNVNEKICHVILRTYGCRHFNYAFILCKRY